MKNQRDGSALSKCFNAACLSLLIFTLKPAGLSAFTLISNAGQPAYWADSSINFALHAVPPQLRSAVENSFYNWSEVEGVRFDFINLGSVSQPGNDSDGKNTVSWVSENWSSLPFFPDRNVLAVTLSTFDDKTGEILDADIFVNAEHFEWGILTDTIDTRVDVENVLTHEVGHLLGLDHSSENLFESDYRLREASMFFASGAGEISRRELKESDIDGILSLYSIEVPEVPVIENIEILEQTRTMLLLKIEGKHFDDLTSVILSAGSNFIFDRVSRYRSTVSDREIVAEFNISNWPVSKPKIVVANSPFELSSVKIDLNKFEGMDGQQFGSSGLRSSGGSGGCQITSSRTPSIPIVLFVALALGLVFRGRRI